MGECGSRCAGYIRYRSDVLCVKDGEWVLRGVVGGEKDGATCASPSSLRPPRPPTKHRTRWLPRGRLVPDDTVRSARDALSWRRRDRQDRRPADARRRGRRYLGARCARCAGGHRAQRCACAARGARQAAHGAPAPPRRFATPAHAVDHGRPHLRRRCGRPSSSSRGSAAGGSASSGATTRQRWPSCSAGLPERAVVQAHGALVQELVPPLGFDLRIVVALDHVIGAISRVAAPGEWRTNVALGAERAPVATPPPDACALALAAARATGAALVGVDLLPDDRRPLDGGRDQRSGRVHAGVRAAARRRSVRGGGVPARRAASAPGRWTAHAAPTLPRLSRPDRTERSRALLDCTC